MFEDYELPRLKKWKAFFNKTNRSKWNTVLRLAQTFNRKTFECINYSLPPALEMQIPIKYAEILFQVN